jgi:hypothetical protein
MNGFLLFRRVWKMNKAMFKDVWLNIIDNKYCKYEIRIDWDNDRHHAVAIPYPYDANMVVEALHRAISLIREDQQKGLL